MCPRAEARRTALRGNHTIMVAQSVPAPPHMATLTIVRTSPNCLSFRLLANGRTVYTTRSFDFGPALDEARRRVLGWAARHEYPVVEESERRRQRAS